MPPGGGPPPALPVGALIPVQGAPDVKAMGSLPAIFDGDRSKANDFIEEVKLYLRLNADVAGYDSPIKKVSFTLTLIKGPEVADWVKDMGHWLDQLNLATQNVPYVWILFLHEFAKRFQDTMRVQTTRKEISKLKMKFPDADGYISKFEQLA
jgi:hypothetical protein